MNAANPRDEKLALGMVAAWVCACFVAAWDSLPLPNIGFAQDLGIMVDAGWRFYQGQRTHADYHSPLGPVLGMLFGIPMWVAGPRYESLTLLPPVVSSVTAFWTCALCRGTLRAIPRAAASVALGGVSGGIYHLGFPPEILSFATFYNRVGFGLLAIVALAALLPRRAETPTQSWFLDCSTLVATIVLFFLKANFAAAALVFVGIAVVCQSRSGRAFWGTAGVGSVVLMMFLASIGFRVDRMLGDFLMAASSRAEMVGDFFHPMRNGLANADFILLAAVYSAVCAPLGGASREAWRALAVHMLVLWLPLVTGVAITLAQSHGDGRGVVTIIAGFAASLAWLDCQTARIRVPFGGAAIEPCRVESSAHSGDIAARLRLRACSVLMLAAAILFIVPHAQSYARWFSMSQLIAGRQFEQDPMKKLFVASYVNSWGEQFPALTNEGCQLLKRFCGADDAVQYIDVSNLFNFACGVRSPRRSMLWWDKSTYSPQRHPTMDSFTDTRFILIPKQPMFAPTLERWIGVYGVLLEKEYELHAESAHFRLYRRK